MKKVALMLVVALCMLVVGACAEGGSAPEIANQPAVGQQGQTDTTEPASADTEPAVEPDPAVVDSESVVDPTVPTSTAAENDEVFALVMAANTPIEGLTSFEMRRESNIVLDFMGESMGLGMRIDLQQVFLPDGEAEIAIATTIDMGELGVENMVMYIADGYLFQDGMGMRYRIALNEEDIEAMAEADENLTLIFPRDALRNSSVGPAGDGNTRFELILDGSIISMYLAELIAEMLLVMGMGTEGIDLVFNDVYYEIVISPANHVVAEHIVFDLEMSFMGDVMSAYYDLRVMDVSYNTLTRINFPDNLDEFPEFSF